MNSATSVNKMSNGKGLERGWKGAGCVRVCVRVSARVCAGRGWGGAREGGKEWERGGEGARQVRIFRFLTPSGRWAGGFRIQQD